MKLPKERSRDYWQVREQRVSWKDGAEPVPYRGVGGKVGGLREAPQGLFPALPWILCGLSETANHQEM